MEPGAKGGRRLGHRRQEVQEGTAEERTAGTGRQGVPAELRAAAPRLPAGECPEPPSPPTFTWPVAASDSEQPVERPEQARRGRGEGGRFLPGPWERGTEGGVVGVGSDRSRSGQLGAYLSNVSASSLFCWMVELDVKLEEDVPTRISTIPPGAHSHRHRSNRNNRNRGAGSSPPLGYWPRAANEHAQSSQSRESRSGGRYLRSTGLRPRGPAPVLSHLPLPPLPSLL